MTYQEKQAELFQEIETSAKLGNQKSTIVDMVSDYENDNRISLASVAFLPETIVETISHKVVEPLKLADPSQYYYLPQSFHITIRNIRTVNNPPLFNNEDIEKVKAVFNEVIPKRKRFNFHLRGIFELPTSLAIKACSDELLKFLVQELGEGLERAGVPDNKKYASDEVFFGNTTICRFTTSPSDQLLKRVSELKDIEIGEVEARIVSLITTNCVCHPKWTKIIQTYELA